MRKKKRKVIDITEFGEKIYSAGNKRYSIFKFEGLDFELKECLRKSVYGTKSFVGLFDEDRAGVIGLLYNDKKTIKEILKKLNKK